MVSEKKEKKRMQASTRGAVNSITFTATCGRKLCTGYTAISRKVVGNVHATTQKGIMGYDQDTVPHSVAIERTVLFF